MAGNSQGKLARGAAPSGLVAPQKQGPSKEELAVVKNDAKLVSDMVLGSVFNGEGINQLLQVAQGAGENMPAAIAHALFMNISQARNALMKNQLPVDGRVWTAKGGVVDRVILDTAEVLASNLGEQFVEPRFRGAVRQELLGLMAQEEEGAMAAQEAPQGPPMEQGMPPEAMPPEGAGMAPPGLMAPQQGGMV